MLRPSCKPAVQSVGCSSGILLGQSALGPTEHHFLPKENGRHRPVHLASRGAAFRPQFIQRLLTGPAHLFWRPVARAIVECCGGPGLADSLFLLDLSRFKLDSFPTLYNKGLFNMWVLFQKERPKNCDFLFWLLKEPVVHGTCLQCEAETSETV